MLIEQALMTYLLAQSGITSLVGQRIYFAGAPQEVTKPYIIVTKLESPEVNSHDGPAGLAHPRFDISAYAAKYGVAKNISSAIKTALDGYSGTMGGVSGLTVDIPGRDDESDDYYADEHLYEVSSEYTIWYKE